MCRNWARRGLVSTSGPRGRWITAARRPRPRARLWSRMAMPCSHRSPSQRALVLGATRNAAPWLGNALGARKPRVFGRGGWICLLLALQAPWPQQCPEAPPARRATWPGVPTAVGACRGGALTHVPCLSPHAHQVHWPCSWQLDGLRARPAGAWEATALRSGHGAALG